MERGFSAASEGRCDSGMRVQGQVWAAGGWDDATLRGRVAPSHLGDNVLVGGIRMSSSYRNWPEVFRFLLTVGIVLTDMSPCNDGCLPPGGSESRTAGNRNYLTGWGGLGWRLGGGRGGCDTRCSPRLAIRDAGLQWGNERELRESVANHEAEVVCVAAGASESSFAGLLGWRGGFRPCSSTAESAR